MNLRTTDVQRLAAQLFQLLVEDGWHQKSSARGLQFFAAPEKLGFKGSYTIALPLDPTRHGAADLVHDAASALLQIYGINEIGDLLDRAATLTASSAPARLVSRFVDRKTSTGAMPLKALAAYVTNMQLGIYRSAKFKLGPDFRKSELAARQFADECMFLQTTEGSFVATVEIPSIVLKQADLFDGSAVESVEVCSALFSAIQFLNDSILKGEGDFEEPKMLEEVIALFDVELLESLQQVISAPEMDMIEFSLQVGSRIRVTSTGCMSLEARNRLSDFVRFVRERLIGEDDIDVAGAIIELRSRDPEGNRNHIRVAADHYGDRLVFSATLNNEQYQQAVEAHRRKHSVRLVGSGVRLKTSIRITKLTFFGG